MADVTLGGGNPGWSAVDTSSFRIQMPMFDPNDGAAGGDGSAGAGGGQPGGAGGSGQQNSQNASGGGQQSVAGAGGQGNADKVFTFKEDRSDWMPRHRFNEQGGKLTAAEQRAVAAEQALEQERKRVRALTGVEPQDPNAKDIDAIKQTLAQLYPGISILEKFTPEQLEQMQSQIQGAQATTEAQWQRHATGMLDGLHEEAKKIMGVSELSVSQRGRLNAAYREEAAQALQARKHAAETGMPYDASNDFLARHERGDKTLIADFAKAYLDDFYTPARRQVGGDMIRRGNRPVPRGERGRILPAAGQQQVNLNDPNEFKKALLGARGGGQE